MDELDKWVNELNQKIATEKVENQINIATEERTNTTKVLSIRKIKKDYTCVLPHEMPPLG
ncbi:hypothetical protein [Shewanella aestuarii]|uniref:Uncharacterized protein n=1 Tax=Shewanella aestuarii TaxID=1028752 RepID=A0A6G9QRN3_9GAMM|nr:hypothetical protein [Shewanella aestuarii]QIR16469.1 hypothetical protein HBH39_18530 [Shewanella aestuarii]